MNEAHSKKVLICAQGCLMMYLLSSYDIKILLKFIQNKVYSAFN